MEAFGGARSEDVSALVPAVGPTLTLQACLHPGDSPIGLGTLLSNYHPSSGSASADCLAVIGLGPGLFLYYGAQPGGAGRAVWRSTAPVSDDGAYHSLYIVLAAGADPVFYLDATQVAGEQLPGAPDPMGDAQTCPAGAPTDGATVVGDYHGQLQLSADVRHLGLGSQVLSALELEAYHTACVASASPAPSPSVSASPAPSPSSSISASISPSSPPSPSRLPSTTSSASASATVSASASASASATASATAFSLLGGEDMPVQETQTFDGDRTVDVSSSIPLVVGVLVFQACLETTNPDASAVMDLFSNMHGVGDVGDCLSVEIAGSSARLYYGGHPSGAGRATWTAPMPANDAVYHSLYIALNGSHAPLFYIDAEPATAVQIDGDLANRTVETCPAGGATGGTAAVGSLDQPLYATVRHLGLGSELVDQADLDAYHALCIASASPTPSPSALPSTSSSASPSPSTTAWLLAGDPSLVAGGASEQFDGTRTVDVSGSIDMVGPTLTFQTCLMTRDSTGGFFDNSFGNRDCFSALVISQAVFVYFGAPASSTPSIWSVSMPNNDGAFHSLYVVLNGTADPLFYVDGQRDYTGGAVIPVPGTTAQTCAAADPNTPDAKAVVGSWDGNLPLNADVRHMGLGSVILDDAEVADYHVRCITSASPTPVPSPSTSPPQKPTPSTTAVPSVSPSNTASQSVTPSVTPTMSQSTYVLVDAVPPGDPESFVGRSEDVTELVPALHTNLTFSSCLSMNFFAGYLFSNIRNGFTNDPADKITDCFTVLLLPNGQLLLYYGAHTEGQSRLPMTVGGLVDSTWHTAGPRTIHLVVEGTAATVYVDTVEMGTAVLDARGVATCGAPADPTSQAQVGGHPSAPLKLTADVRGVSLHAGALDAVQRADFHARCLYGVVSESTTPSESPSAAPTPSITPSPSTTPSITPSPSVTPSATPSASRTLWVLVDDFGTSTTASGEAIQGLHFDGSGIQNVSAAVPTLHTAFTFSACFELAAGIATQTAYVFTSSAQDDCFTLLVSDTSALLRYGGHAGGQLATTWSLTGGDAPLQPAGTFQTVTYVIDGTSAVLYVNGQLAAATVLQGDGAQTCGEAYVGDGSGGAYIGGKPNVPLRMVGQIRHMALHHGAMTADQAAGVHDYCHASPTPSATATASETPGTQSNTPSNSLSSTVTASHTPSSSITATNTASASNTPSNTASTSVTPSVTPTPSPSWFVMVDGLPPNDPVHFNEASADVTDLVPQLGHTGELTFSACMAQHAETAYLFSNAYDDGADTHCLSVLLAGSRVYLFYGGSNGPLQMQDALPFSAATASFPTLSFNLVMSENPPGSGQGQLDFYLNGMLNRTVAMPETLSGTCLDTGSLVGASPVLPQLMMNATITDMRLHSHALTQAQVDEYHGRCVLAPEAAGAG